MKFVLIDEASPLLQMMIDKFPDASRGALKSTGYWAMRKIQGGIQSQAPGGEPYAEFFPQKLRQALDRVLRGRGKSNYPPMGRLQRAVKYQFLNSGARGMSVVVGWTSASAVRLGGMQQEGFSRPMTDSMRRAFDAAFQKLGLKTRIKATTTEIKTPSRKTIPPMATQLSPQITDQFETTFKKYLLSGPESRSPSGHKRQYKVLTL
ncbi:MAG: hypothetical protein ABFC57_17370 [Veillonellales bacterium]